MKILGIIQDHTDNKWQIQDMGPIVIGLSLCSVLLSQLVYFPNLFTTVCIYILITNEAIIASADTCFSCALLQATLRLNCLSLSTLNLNTFLIH